MLCLGNANTPLARTMRRYLKPIDDNLKAKGWPGSSAPLAAAIDRMERAALAFATARDAALTAGLPNARQQATNAALLKVERAMTATALIEDPALTQFAGHVSDSGEGRWTIKAAIDEAVPVPVLTSALNARFSSRGEADFQNKLLSAMRFQFGGHHEKK